MYYNTYLNLFIHHLLLLRISFIILFYFTLHYITFYFILFYFTSFYFILFYFICLTLEKEYIGSSSLFSLLLGMGSWQDRLITLFSASIFKVFLFLSPNN